MTVVAAWSVYLASVQLHRSYIGKACILVMYSLLYSAIREIANALAMGMYLLL